LKVEADNPSSSMGQMFQNVLNVFMKQLESSSPNGKIVANQLKALDDYIAMLAW
jgi:hypothetical protein